MRGDEKEKRKGERTGGISVEEWKKFSVKIEKIGQASKKEIHMKAC